MSSQIKAKIREQFLGFSPPSIGDAERDEVMDTLRSDWITTGPKTKKFEKMIQERLPTFQFNLILILIFA